MTATAKIRIGARGSPLALAQANEVRDRLAAAHENLASAGAVEIVVIKTTGDRILDRALADAGGKGLFTKEIDEALFDGRIDIAVHSMKDVPTELPAGIVLPCMLEREDTRDVLIADVPTIAALPRGAVVGTASLRRGAQLKHRRPDLEIAVLRGNVQTRLGKVGNGEVAATLLALAGLKRLGLEDVGTPIAPEDMLPAVGQGAIGIALRDGDGAAGDLLSPLNHPETVIRVAAERAFLRLLDGSCRTPIAAEAVIDGEAISFRGLIARPDGSQLFKASRQGPVARAEEMGRDAGEELRALAGPGFFDNG
jgi:hydroxymethylbilane synthase